MYVPEIIRKTGLRRGLSINTIKTYIQCVNVFFKKCKTEDPKKVTKKDINAFLDKLVEKGSCGNTLNVYLNSLKFFYNEILGKRLMVNIKYSKVPKRIPEFLTKEEIVRLILAVKNPKHRLMMCLKYSSGIRVGELVKLKVDDLEIEDNYGWVRQGKGGKDRLFIIAKNLKDDLKRFIEENNLEHHNYLFKGSKGGHLTRETFRMVVKNAMIKADIKKNISSHSLRHSFATHIIEQGDDVISLQSLLGHSSSRTTMVYVHANVNNLINIKSPYDSLVLE
jgi:site-specific recombinase XerD